MHRELQVSSCFCSECCRAAGPQHAAGVELQSELHDASTSPSAEPLQLAQIMRTQVKVGIDNNAKVALIAAVKPDAK